jgi:hypothetical protein
MAGVTTFNGWDYPTSTDYVKDGATAMQTLAQDIDTSVNRGLLTWIAWTPTVTNVTKGTGSAETYVFARLGKLIFVRGTLQLGTGGTVTGSPTFSLPVTPNAGISTNAPQFNNIFLDVSASAQYQGHGIIVSGNAVLRNWTVSGTAIIQQNPSGTVPFTWSTSDAITFAGVYEAA